VVKKFYSRQVVFCVGGSS